MTDQTATETLRQLLDERGVEWTANDGEHVKETCWSYMGELMAAFAEFDNGTTRFACDTWCFTPEQAIEATLGRGTCSLERAPQYGEDCMACSGCGCVMDDYLWSNFCPNCGRKVQ